MKFKKIELKDKNAQRVYDNYINSIRNVLKPILDSDRQEVLMEFNSHIYESLQNNKSKLEIDILLNTIEKLGSPEVVLKPLIADKLLERATKSFNPLQILKALSLNITNGVSYIIFFLLYLSLGSFIFLIFAKLFNSNVGMYFKEGKFQAIGFVKNNSDYQEVLGYWFIPVMILLTATLFIIITLLLKFKKAISKK
ncbi:HAAS signaling domain-containing protein [Formosa sp. PL04]|uniref:HAAS signaling domain-containing protein n=1 Tax=Formosa sp. PL04 TaxID=3081755 RepID=UPI002981C2C5|nr:hypothetical protein [Formosa sp. PL04]MDW5290723.1 hypothetical protein [Formosa sp. PL04]